MTAQQYEHWLTVSRRISPQLGEDLLHDALIAIMEAGRGDLADPSNQRYLRGVLELKHRHLARTNSRRRKRESASHLRNARATTNPTGPSGQPDASEAALENAAVRALPRSLRSVCALVLHGLTRAEIQFALNLSDTAFRRRLSDLRKAVLVHLGNSKDELNALYESQPREPRLDVGLMRQALVRWLRIGSGVGLSDPDGHLIVATFSGSIRRSPSQSRRSRQQRG